MSPQLFGIHHSHFAINKSQLEGYIAGDVLGRVPSCQHTGTACDFGKVTAHVQPRGETKRAFLSWGPRENQWGTRARLLWLARDNFLYLFPTPCSVMSHWEIEIGHMGLTPAQKMREHYK